MQSLWSAGHDHQPPEGIASCKQKAWDGLRAGSIAELLQEGAENSVERARLLAVSTKESAAWLRALPVTAALGLRMDDSTVRVTVGVRLGTAICGPHLANFVGWQLTGWVGMPSAVSGAWEDTDAMRL